VELADDCDVGLFFRVNAISSDFANLIRLVN
jgi:hypothetical protein